MMKSNLIKNEYEFPSFTACDILTTTNNKITGVEKNYVEELINTNEYLVRSNENINLWRRFKFNENMELIEYNDNLKNFIKCEYVEGRYKKSFTNIDCFEEELLECIYMFENKNYLYDLIF